MNIFSEARYFSEEFEELGSGPLPPTVGEKTTYKIFLTLSNTFNDLSDVVVSTTLPSSIIWEKDTSADEGTISFDSKNQTVTWRITEVKAHTGTFFPNLIASFSVSLTPKAQDVGDAPTLMNKVVVAGRDEFTDQKLTDEATAVNTSLEKDLGAQGKGKVVESP